MTANHFQTHGIYTSIKKRRITSPHQVINSSTRAITCQALNFLAYAQSHAHSHHNKEARSVLALTDRGPRLARDPPRHIKYNKVLYHQDIIKNLYFLNAIRCWKRRRARDLQCAQLARRARWPHSKHTVQGFLFFLHLCYTPRGADFWVLIGHTDVGSRAKEATID